MNLRFAALVGLFLSFTGCTVPKNPVPPVAEARVDAGKVLETLVSKLADAGSPAALPFGGTSRRYNDHTFWDSDVWGFPALALTRPDIAKEQPLFRFDHRGAAKENFKKWQAAGYPVANKGHHMPLPELVALAGGIEPMMYPWETVDGTELTPNPDTKYQHHVTGGVAWMMHRAIQLGLFDKARGEEVIKGCAAFYLWRLDRNPDGTFGLRGVVSPDEWHTVDNDLYTNALADWTIRRAYGEKVWPRGRMRFPKRGGTFATFDGDTYTTYKQAAALLAVFPLQHPDIVPDSREMYRLYRGRYSKTGPAMANAIDSVVACRIGQPEMAWEDWLASWEPYSDSLADEFRETPKSDEGYFLTGAAACVNAVVYGFCGIEIHDGVAPPGTPAIPLVGTGWMGIDPTLPKGALPVSARFTVLGKSLEISARCGEDGATVSTIRYGGKVIADNYSRRPRK